MVSPISTVISFEPLRISFLLIGVYGEALDNADLQIIPDRSHFVRIHVLHVWMARPREGHFIGPRTIEVCPLAPSCIIGG